MAVGRAWEDRGRDSGEATGEATACVLRPALPLTSLLSGLHQAASPLWASVDLHANRSRPSGLPRGLLMRGRTVR